MQNRVYAFALCKASELLSILRLTLAGSLVIEPEEGGGVGEIWNSNRSGS